MAGWAKRKTLVSPPQAGGLYDFFTAEKSAVVRYDTCRR